MHALNQCHPWYQGYIPLKFWAVGIHVCSPRGSAYTFLLELKSGSCSYLVFSGRISLSHGARGHGAALQDAVKGIGFARLENLGSTHGYPW